MTIISVICLGLSIPLISVPYGRLFVDGLFLEHRHALLLRSEKRRGRFVRGLYVVMRIKFHYEL